MKYLVISSSLNPQSKSRILAEFAFSTMKTTKEDIDFIDLRDYPLPICDGDRAYSDDNAQILKKRIDSAQAIVIATPVYNFNINAAIKNLVELTGSVWKEKVVGFVCSAGGKGSYMALMPFANSLMLDFRCLIIPRFVFATKNDFNENEISNQDIRDRLLDLINRLQKVAGTTAK